MEPETKQQKKIIINVLEVEKYLHIQKYSVKIKYCGKNHLNLKCNSSMKK